MGVKYLARTGSVQLVEITAQATVVLVEWDTARLKRQATIAASIACVIIFAIGILAFALALRPCRVSFQPGMVVPYKLTTSTCEILADGKRTPAHSEDREIDLVCTGPDNEVALICPSPDNNSRHDQVTLLSFGADGTVRRLDAAARPGDGGAAIGFFDFNLMPLPAGSEQPKDVSITYAALPFARNPVQGRVRRTKSGTKPTFKLTLQSSVEWLNSDNRYHQIRDLVSTYRFNTAKGVVDHANIKLLAGIECEDGAHRYDIDITLELSGPIHRTDDDPKHLRDAVMATVDAQEVLSGEHHERLGAVTQRLRAAEVGMPPLRALADRLLNSIQHPGEDSTVSRRYSLQMAEGSARERRGAEALTHSVQAGGFPAYLAQLAAGKIAVFVGPYPAPDPVVLSNLKHAFPAFSPAWIEVAP